MQGSLVELAKDYIHRKNSLSLSQQLAAANGSMAGVGVVCPVPLSALRFGLAWAHMCFVHTITTTTTTTTSSYLQLPCCVQ